MPNMDMDKRLRKFQFTVSHTSEVQHVILTKLQETNVYSYAVVIRKAEKWNGVLLTLIKGFVCANRRVDDIPDWLGDALVTGTLQESDETLESRHIEEASRPGCAMLLHKGTLEENKKLFTSTQRLTFTLAGCCRTESVSRYLGEVRPRSKLIIAVKSGATILGFIHLKRNAYLSTVYNRLRNWGCGIRVVRISHVAKTTSDASIKQSYMDIVKNGGELFFTSQHCRLSSSVQQQEEPQHSEDAQPTSDSESDIPQIIRVVSLNPNSGDVSMPTIQNTFGSKTNVPTYELMSNASKSPMIATTTNIGNSEAQAVSGSPETESVCAIGVSAQENPLVTQTDSSSSETDSTAEEPRVNKTEPQEAAYESESVTDGGVSENVTEAERDEAAYETESVSDSSVIENALDNFTLQNTHLNEEDLCLKRYRRHLKRKVLELQTCELLFMQYKKVRNNLFQK